MAKSKTSSSSPLTLPSIQSTRTPASLAKRLDLETPEVKEQRTETLLQKAKQDREDRANPLKQKLGNTTPLDDVDAFIARFAHERAVELRLKAGFDFYNGLKDNELTLLRQATLRAHRKAMGKRAPAPTIMELDEMIISVGPFACENMIRKAVDERRGEVDRHNDAIFLNDAKKI